MCPMKRLVLAVLRLWINNRCNNDFPVHKHYVMKAYSSSVRTQALLIDAMAEDKLPNSYFLSVPTAGEFMP
jgi:hypothetical protein